MQLLSLSQQLQRAYPPKVQEISGRYAAKSDIPAIVESGVVSSLCLVSLFFTNSPLATSPIQHHTQL